MQTSSHILEPDAQAIFLLCGRFGKHESDKSAKPLSLAEYNAVAEWLRHQDLRPASLLREEGREKLKAFDGAQKVNRERLHALLRRSTAMAMAVETWTNQGGWLLARSDANYPVRLRRRLQHKAPPILWGVGPQELLNRGGLSIVGSRDADGSALAYVRDMASRCARQGVQVISGGARGVDGEAMEAALEGGGTVVGALANGLGRAATAKKYRSALMEGRLVLVSAYHPDSRFAVWKAMDRNKHVYSLSDGTLVAHSAKGSGGTWAGATENLRHRWVPLFVLAEPPLPEGNRALIEQGGIPIDRRLLRDDFDLASWLETPSALNEEPTLADALINGHQKDSDTESADASAAVFEEYKEYLVRCRAEGEKPELLPLVWPALKSVLQEPQGERDIQEHFADAQLGQIRSWLMKAVEKGLAERSERPVLYRVSEQHARQEESTESGRAQRGAPAENNTTSQGRDLFSQG